MMSYFVGDGDRAKLDLPRRGWKNKMQVKGMSRISVCEGVRRKKVVQEVSSSGSSSDNRAGRGPWTMSKKPDILALHKQVTSRVAGSGGALWVVLVKLGRGDETVGRGANWARPG